MFSELKSRKNPKLLSYLVLGYCPLIFIFILMGGLLLLALQATSKETREIADYMVPISDAAYEMEINANGMAMAMLGYIHTPNEKLVDRFYEDSEEFCHFLEKFKDLSRTERQRQESRSVEKLFTEFYAIGQELVNQRKDAIGLANFSVIETQAAYVPRIINLREQIDDILDDEIQNVTISNLSTTTKDVGLQIENANWLFMVFLTLALLSSTTAIIFQNRNILTPVKTMSKMAATVIRGTPKIEVIHTGPKEIVDTAEALNFMHKTVKTYLDKLEENNKILDQKVIERTNDLQLAKQEAEIANKTKTLFLANMSHELRTPLNAIIGFSEMMKTEVLGPIQEQYHSYVEEILVSGRHLFKLVDDILEMSRIEIGKVEIFEGEVELPLLIEDCIRRVSDKADQKRISIKKCIPSNVPVLWADQNRFKQALLYILGNAIKYTQSDGAVIIRVDMTESNLLVKIKDNGEGIPEDKISHILEPFTQVDSSFTRKHGGSGLGLPIAKALIELHGGSISIKSEVNVGTEVDLILPKDRIMAMDERESKGT